MIEEDGDETAYPKINEKGVVVPDFGPFRPLSREKMEELLRKGVKDAHELDKVLKHQFYRPGGYLSR